MERILDYHREAQAVLNEIASTQRTAIAKAAEWVADTIAGDGIVYALGSGHSLMIAAELYYRAGGMAPFDVLHDKTFGRAERLRGYAKVLLDSYPVTKKDLIVIVSNSGRNPLPVEMALEARQRGVRTIALTSMRHARSVAPLEGLPGSLFEVADLVIDNCGKPGDASVEIDPAFPVAVGPTSTIAGIFVVNSLVVEAARILFDRGLRPPVFLSANVDQGDNWNAPLVDYLRQRIRGL